MSFKNLPLPQSWKRRLWIVPPLLVGALAIVAAPMIKSKPTQVAPVERAVKVRVRLLLDYISTHEKNLHDSLEDFSAFSHLPHRVVRFRRSWPRGRWSRLLVLAKSEAPLTTE